MLIDELLDDAEALLLCDLEPIDPERLIEIGERISRMLDEYSQMRNRLAEYGDEDDGQPDDVKEHEDFAHDNDYSPYE
jgi:hypothetical protein